MRTVTSPSIAPVDQDVYLVVDDIRPFGVVYREADESLANEARVVQDILDAQYERVVRVVAFNTAEGWSRDVSEDIAREVALRAIERRDDLTPETLEFIEEQLGEGWRSLKRTRETLSNYPPRS